MRPPNETVEKPNFEKWGVSPQRQIIQSKGIEAGCQGLDGLGECPKRVDLANIVNQSK